MVRRPPRKGLLQVVYRANSCVCLIKTWRRFGWVVMSSPLLCQAHGQTAARCQLKLTGVAPRLCALQNFSTKARRIFQYGHLSVEVGKICVLQRLIDRDAVLGMKHQLPRGKSKTKTRDGRIKDASLVAHSISASSILLTGKSSFDSSGTVPQTTTCRHVSRAATRRRRSYGYRRLCWCCGPASAPRGKANGLLMYRPKQSRYCTLRRTHHPS